MLMGPFISQQPVHDVVDVAVIEPLRIAKHPFFEETEPFRKRPALHVPSCDPNLDFIEFQITEPIIDDRLERLTHDALALKVLAEPIADRPAFDAPVDVIEADRPGELVLIHNRERFRIAARFQQSFNSSFDVLPRILAVSV